MAGEYSPSNISANKPMMYPLFLNVGKIASEVQSLSKNAVHLISKELATLNINKISSDENISNVRNPGRKLFNFLKHKKVHLVDKLRHTDIPHFKKSVELKPQSAEANYNLGSILLKKGRTNEALLYFKRAALWDFHNIDAYLGMVKAYQELWQFDEAIDVLKTAITYDENNAEVYYQLGMTYNKKGICAKGINALKRAIKLRPDFKEARDALSSLQEAV